MANLENNNSENKKPLSEKVEGKVQEALENIKNTIEHPLETAKQAAKDVKKLSWWAKLFLWSAGIFVFLFFAILIVINLPSTKNYIADKVLGTLNRDFGINISKENAEINIFGDVIIRGLKIKDFKNNDMILAKELRADSDWFSIVQSMVIDKKNQLDFSTLSLKNADVKIVTYKGDSIDNFNRFIAKFDDGSPRNPNKPPFKLNSRVEIRDSKISIINQNHEGDEGKWLQAENVNLIVPELNVVGAKVKAKINNFTFRTNRWGKSHFVDTFSGDLDLDGEHLTLKDLTFFTDHSLLQGDLTFNLDKKTHWQDFNNKVVWDMNLKRGSSIAGYDISYFATKWDNYSAIDLSGKMYGSLNDFRVEDFVLKGKDVNINTPNTKFKDLLKGNFNIVTNKISADITYPALRAMVPKFVSTKMKNFADPFGRIRYVGAVDVTPKRVIAKGNAITSIGRANADIVLSDIDKNEPRYKGVLDIKDFNAAAITKNNAVGLITGKFNVDGRGFDVNTLTLKTKSNISSIVITGKTINNLFLDGTLSRKKYDGVVTINDEEAKGKIVGKIDFSTSRLLADINGDIDYLNLSYFGVPGNGKSIFSGSVNGKIAFSNVNDMNLDAQLNNVTFTANNQKIEFPNGQVKAFFEDGNRIVSVDMPNVVKGDISGKYNLGDLGKMFQNGFDKVLVGNPEKRYFKGQNFTYNFEVSQQLVNYFEPNLKISDGAKIDGSFDGNTNNILLNASIPALKYLMTKKEEISEADQLLSKANPEYIVSENKPKKDSAMINNIFVRINTANPSEQISVNIERAEYAQNVLKDVTLMGTNEDDKILHLVANFKHGTLEDEEKDDLVAYAVHLNQSKDEAGDYVIRFEPTDLKIDNFVWSVDTSPELDHSITYRKSTSDFVIKNLRLFSEESEIFVNGTFKNAKDFNADVDVKNLEIDKILDLLPGKNTLDLKGIANGNVKIKMDKTNLEPLMDLSVKDIILNGKNMGEMTISAKNSDVPNVYDVNAKIASSDLLGKNHLELAGTVNNNTPSPILDLTADLNEFDLSFVQAFVNGIFSNFRGKASGLVAISGPLNDINYGGDVAMKDFGLKINFNGVDYSFQDTTLTLNNGMILLNEPIKLNDGRGNSKGTLSLLQVDLSNLTNIKAQVFVRSEDLMLLNTEQKDFDLFWGKIYGKGDLFVSFNDGGLKIEAGKDNENDPTQEIETFKVLDNSVFTLNSNSATSVDEFKLLRFLKADKEGVVSVEKNAKKGVNLDLNLLISVNKGSTVNVLVGDEVGDITVRGSSEKLKFKMTPNGKIILLGSYLVDNGNYEQKLFLKKSFQIDKNSSIAWDGDPFAPDLKITASYVRSVTNASEYLSTGKLPPVNVRLQTKITNTLKNPKIEFDVSAPDASTQIREALAVKMSNNDERTLQFGSILVLNNFNTSASGGFGDVSIQDTGISTGANILLKQLGNIVNNISQQFQVDISYIKGTDGTESSDRANTNVNITVSPRITLKTGFGVPISKTANSSNYLTGEGIVEYDVSKNNDGTLVLRAYSKPSNIGLTGVNGNANQSFGAGVVYSKSFNSLFRKNKKNNDSLKVKSNIKIDSIRKDSTKQK
ncbi:DUF490 domain-containing protein [Cloacibacterium rupense]|uniref:DUF490 domain-containing protein n=1 Tax=Cloacibacterium rupense TaxID=517423 RepID=A0ABQ2NKE5_9FLAO|nr:translocation/assembly module TamB [Cloacibacterium rupense]GGP04329.1 DUF490 domain-containing protein [Cloacibacterium rupense]